MRRPRALPSLAWTLAAALVVLSARTLAYALEPAPLAQALSAQAGGPALPLVTIVAGVLAVALSSAVLWLAALGVAERARLAPAGTGRHRRPRLRLGAFAVRTGALFVVTSLAFALFESWLHWRAGLGWHGLHCLVGPVHRDAVPILAALSLLAAALATALEHVLAWMRRTLERLRAAAPPEAAHAPLPSPRAHPAPRGRLSGRPFGARGPPAVVG